MLSLRRAALALSLVLVASAAGAADIAGEIAAVERIRGLKFTEAVTTVDIDRKELPARLREQFEKTLPYSVEQWGDVLRALRLVGRDDQDSEIVSSLIDLYESQVLAYYDPASKTFFVVKQLPDAIASIGDMAGPLNAGVRIHELTHALQDQHFHLGDIDEETRDDTDANLAWHALVEGEASLVMMQYMIENAGGAFDEMIKTDMLSGAIAAMNGQAASLGGPRYFAEMLKFPYIDGMRFVVDAYRRGGWKEMDRVYQNPPRSTREILHPDEYFAKRFKPATFQPLPSLPVASLLSVEHLGQWHWAFLAGAKNAEGWTSDRVTIAENKFCEPTVLVDTQWDSDQHARSFFDAYTRFLDDDGSGSLHAIDGRRVRVAYGADRPLMERFIDER
jgi:hypothetical protein